MVDDPAAPAPPSGGHAVLLGHTLLLTGEVGRAAVRRLDVDALGAVTTVDLSAVTYLDGAAIGVLLCCIQLGQRRCPPTRLLVRGADPRVLDTLHMLGVDDLLDFEA